MRTALFCLIVFAGTTAAQSPGEPKSPDFKDLRVYTSGHSHHCFVGELLPGIGKSVNHTQVGDNFIGMANTQKL
jgi:hypothetical protein